MQEHLMVDGNNAMHAIREVAREMERDRNQARIAFLKMLEPLAAFGHRVTVVFDGTAGRGSLERREGFDSFDVHFSSSSEGADGAIERMVMAAKNPGRICVVTNDGLIRNCAYEHGASAMRVEELLKKLDHSIDQVTRRLREANSGFVRKEEPFRNNLSFPKDFLSEK